MKRETGNKDIRVFGLIWFAILFVIAVYPTLYDKSFRLLPLILSFLFLLPSLLYPKVLIIPFKLWMKFGEFTNKIISFIVLFILYYFLITPIGFVARFFGSDFLENKIDGKKTFWKDRENQPDSMKYQY